MSNAALTAVFASSKAEGLARLIMLSIADRADDEGRAYCGAADLCRRTLGKRANVFRALKKLRELGELEVIPRTGPGCCNRYVIRLNQCPRDTSVFKELVSLRPRGSVLGTLKPSEPNKGKKRRPRL